MAKIVIEGRGEELTYNCDDSDTLARAALRAGIGFPYACNVGSCGTCKCQVLEGEVRHAREDSPAWSERDLKRNRFLGCQSIPQGDCRIKLRLDDTYVPEHRPVKTEGELLERVDLTHDIIEFRFKMANASGFLPGQYALISVPGVEGGRAYSMCNLPGDGTEWHFQIKKVPGGAATTELFDNLKPGDRVAIDGPYGTAYVRPESERDILCIAGGSGLSPMISIARAAAADPNLSRKNLDFVFGGRTGKDICGEDILKELPGFGDTIHYHAAISNPEDDDGNWDGHTGFVHDVAQQLLGDEELARREIYFAGPPAMAQAVQKLLFQLKVSSDQVHYDEFY